MPLYADYNSTAPLRPEVCAAIEPYLRKEFGNASALLSPLGRRAAEAVERARAAVAALVNAEPAEVVFVSGGTESCFQAIVGALLSRKLRRIFTSSIEHSAVLNAAEFAAQVFSVVVEKMSVNSAGDLQLPSDCSDALVSLQLANNEVGLLLPVADLATSRHCGFFHTDATQAVGRVPVDFPALGVDAMSFSAHKFGGPKGIGALVLRSGCDWQPIITGGGQQEGRRGGTLPVHQIIGMGVAAELAQAELDNGLERRLGAVRDDFEQALSARLADVKLLMSGHDRLPNTSCLSVSGIIAKTVVAELGESGVVVATGSACHSGSFEPSHVLRALGLSTQDALSTLRVSFGYASRAEDAADLAKALAESCERFRGQAQAELQNLLQNPSQG